MGPHQCLTLRVGIYFIVIRGEFFLNRDRIEKGKLRDRRTLLCGRVGVLPFSCVHLIGPLYLYVRDYVHQAQSEASLH